MSVRLQNTELVVPIIVGTVAIHLGKKANEYATHKWTLYVRSATNEDISHIIRKITFKLHPSFKDPERTVEGPSFELTETGWGEFEIIAVLHFAPDAQEKDVELLHRLKLYADDDPTGQGKKPVVSEQYEELVFSQPHQGFYQRVMAHQPRPRPQLSIEPHILTPSEAPDLAVINEARRKVAIMAAQLRMQHVAQAAESPSGMAGGHM